MGGPVVAASPVQLQYTLCNSVIIPDNGIIKLNLQFHSPLPLGHVTSWWEKGELNFAFRCTVVTKGFMSQQKQCLLSPSRNLAHDTDLPFFTQASLWLHSYLLSAVYWARMSVCRLYVYIHKYFKYLGTWLDIQCQFLSFPYWQCQNKVTGNTPVTVSLCLPKIP